MDPSLQGLRQCERLSLSTNAIDKIQNVSGLPIRILSLGRNNLKKLDGIEELAESLEQLWISYNIVEKLVGIEKCKRMKILYASNNKISSWEEIDRLSELPNLEDLLLLGNPLYMKYCEKGQIEKYKEGILKRIPRLKKLDGKPILTASSDSDLEEE